MKKQQHNWPMGCSPATAICRTMTGASAPNAATGKAVAASAASSLRRTSCSATIACNFVARSRKYLLGAEAEVMA